MNQAQPDYGWWGLCSAWVSLAFASSMGETTCKLKWVNYPATVSVVKHCKQYNCMEKKQILIYYMINWVDFCLLCEMSEKKKKSVPQTLSRSLFQIACFAHPTIRHICDTGKYLVLIFETVYQANLLPFLSLSFEQQSSSGYIFSWLTNFCTGVQTGINKVCLSLNNIGKFPWQCSGTCSVCTWGDTWTVHIHVG